MRRVHVTLDGRGVYTGWIPEKYSVQKLIVQVLLHWDLFGSTQVKDCRLFAVTAEPSELSLDTTLATIDSNRFCLVISRSISFELNNTTQEERVIDCFRIYALQNPWGRDGLYINWQQFKGITKWLSHQNKRQVEWSTAQMIAYKSNALSSLGLNFDGFLHAWAYLGQYQGLKSCKTLDDVYTLILETMSKPSLVLALEHCAAQHWCVKLAPVRKLLAKFAKTLHYLVSSFVSGFKSTMSFTEFQAFWSALHFNHFFYLSSEEIASAFVFVYRTNAPSTNFQVKFSDVMIILLHLGLLALPRIIPTTVSLQTRESMTASHRFLIQKQSLNEQYFVVVIKILLQHLNQQLTPQTVNEVCQRVFHGNVFRRGVQYLHRAFIAMFQADCECDYMSKARNLWLQEQSSTETQLFTAKSLLKDVPFHDTQSTKLANNENPLQNADALYAQMILLVENGDLESAVNAWAIGTEIYEDALAIEKDDTHANLLLRFATSLLIAAFQIAKLNQTSMQQFALEMVQLASLKFHALWAYLCVKIPEEVDSNLIFSCVLEWANALSLTADLMDPTPPDSALAAKLASVPSNGPTIEFWSLPLDGSRALYYYEACRRYELALTMQLLPSVHKSWLHAKTHLVLELPLGCVASRWLTDEIEEQLDIVESSAEYKVLLSALQFLHQVFSSNENLEWCGDYNDMLQWIILTFSPNGSTLILEGVNQINVLCDCSPIDQIAMQWLCDTFEPSSLQCGLSLQGLQAYFIYLATIDPIQFHKTFLLLMDTYTNREITKEVSPPEAISIPEAIIDNTIDYDLIANSFLLLEKNEVTDTVDIVNHIYCTEGMLPDQMSTFCFPFEPLNTPQFFDTVLTDVQGIPIYIASLHTGRKCFVILSSYPYFAIFHTFLFQLHALPELPLAAIKDFLSTRTPLKKDDAPVLASFLGSKLGTIYFPQSFLPDQIDFAFVFELLSIESIILALACILLEKKIIVKASNPSVLTPICETLRALLSPFESQQVYIPVIPKSLLELLQAPVPYIMGTMALDCNINDAYIIVLDIESNSILQPVAHLLPLNRIQALTKTIQDILRLNNLPTRNTMTAWKDYGKASYNHHSRGSPEAWMELKIAFTSFHLTLIEGFEEYYQPATNSTKAHFNKEKYLVNFPETCAFCEAFFNTQTFSNFLESFNQVAAIHPNAQLSCD